MGDGPHMVEPSMRRDGGGGGLGREEGSQLAH